MAVQGVSRQQVEATLSALVADPRVIRYRQSIVADLAGSDALQRGLAAVIPKVQEVSTLAPLFKDLNRMLKSVSRPLADEVDKYVRVNTQFVSGLVHELGFLLGAVSLMQRLADSGLPVCLPPIGKSYARDIAEQYGISFPKIQRRLQDRRTPPSAEHTGS
jgi:signal transduction histidine kinase